MTRSIIRKTYTGFTGKIDGVTVTLDGSNIRIRVDDPTGEAWLSINDFARLIRHFFIHCLSEVTDRHGWEADNKSLLIPKTPLFINGVQKTREMMKEESRTPRFFRKKEQEAEYDDAIEMIVEDCEDGNLLG